MKKTALYKAVRKAGEGDRTLDFRVGNATFYR